MCNIYVYNVYVIYSPYILYTKYKYRSCCSKYNYLILLILYTVKSNNIIYRDGIFFLPSAIAGNAPKHRSTCNPSSFFLKPL